MLVCDNDSRKLNPDTSLHISHCIVLTFLSINLWAKGAQPRAVTNIIKVSSAWGGIWLWVTNTDGCQRYKRMAPRDYMVNIIHCGVVWYAPKLQSDCLNERVTVWLQCIRSLPRTCAYVALFEWRLWYNHYAIAHIQCSTSKLTCTR